MAKHERVVLADTAADRPSPLGTTAIALVALCTGFASAYALRDRGGDEQVVERPQGEEAAALPSAATPPEAAPAEAAPPEAAPAPPAEPQPQIEPAPAAPPPEPPPPAPSVAAAIPAQREATRDDRATRASASAVDPFADLRLKPGIVAYLRCDGLPQVRGPFPCPRDRSLERRVWNTLRSLERCEPLVDARGTSEIRLELTPSRTEVHVVSGELDRSAVRQCAAGLTSARTELRPTRMIIAFRFALH